MLHFPTLQRSHSLALQHFGTPLLHQAYLISVASFDFNQDLFAFRSERDGQREIYLITAAPEAIDLLCGKTIKQAVAAALI